MRKIISQYAVKAAEFDDCHPAAKVEADAVWQYIKANLDEKLPWSEPADVISALQVVQHIVDTHGFVSRIYNTLRHGGHIVSSTPNINSLRS